MKTISITAFETLIACNDWERAQDYEVVESLEREVEERDEKNKSLNLINIPYICGNASKTSTLDDIKITYTEDFSYDEYDAASLDTVIKDPHEVWSIEGIVVVDENGNELNADELSYYLDSDFSSIDYRMLEIEQVTNIDVDKDSHLETFTLDIDNNPSISFTGEVVANVESPENNGRWTKLFLYKTKSGKFFCHQVGRTLWQGERDRFSGKVCETLEEVKDFFGHRWLAKELYSEAGIDDTIKVD